MWRALIGVVATLAMPDLSAASDFCGDMTGCRVSTVPFVGKLKLSNKARRADKLVWQWKRGQATTLADFGDPLTTTSYELCFAEVGQTSPPIFGTTHMVPAGGMCGSSNCWRATTKGYKFTDKAFYTSRIRSMLLRAGADGQAKVVVKMRGLGLPLPRPPMDLPFVLMLRASNGQCWADVFWPAGVLLNEEFRFTGKSGSPSGAFVD